MTDFEIKGPLHHLKYHLMQSEVKAMLDRIGPRPVVQERELQEILQVLVINVLEKYDAHFQSEIRLLRMDMERRVRFHDYYNFPAPIAPAPVTPKDPGEKE